MSTTQVRIQTPANIILFTDSAIGNAADAIKASSAVLYYLIADNTQNVASSYIKIFNVVAGSVTVGTTAPDMIIYVPASSLITVPFYTGANPGITFGTALTACAVTAAGTAGTVSPSSSVVLTVAYV
jgi:hypothetical protein